MLALFMAVPLFPRLAEAACTDPPRPGVNWQRCTFDRQDLKGVDLQGARLRDGSFFRSDLSGSNLSDSQSPRVKFVNATLHEVRFDGANLYQADMTKADLSGSSFAGADLRQARLFQSNLQGVDLTGARLNGADLTQADLSGATWTDGETICAENSLGRCF